MKNLLFFLLVASVAASTINNTSQPSLQDHITALDFNSTSPFTKVIRTEDIQSRDAIYSTPPVVFIGKKDGCILRCPQEDPNQCEIFDKALEGINSIVVNMHHIYVAAAGVISKCHSCTKQSCKAIHNIGTGVNALAIAKGNLYAGLANGTILLCDLYQSNKCSELHTLGSPVWSLMDFEGYIYAGLESGKLNRCSLRAEHSCTTMYYMSKYITGLSRIGNTIFAITWDGLLWNCSRKSDLVSDYCVSTMFDVTQPRAIASFNGILYLLKQQTSIHTCKWNESCSEYAQHKNAFAMAFVYGTYSLQRRYRDEHTTCTWQSEFKCPPFITYYDESQRSMLEVHIKDGRLYNSVGGLVDTTFADEGHSGIAAIFAMAPDGRILLSNSHKRELLHTSSLFAGSPVSGVGEIVVKSGVIKSISACSVHYRPDLSLNRQVLQSLLSQGYTESITLKMCCEDDECQNTSNDRSNES